MTLFAYILDGVDVSRFHFRSQLAPDPFGQTNIDCVACVAAALMQRDYANPLQPRLDDVVR